MPRMLINVPASVKEMIAAEVAEGRYDDAGNYIARLVRDARKQKAKVKLEQMLRDGLASPSSEMADADWERLKRRVWQRRAKRARK